MRVTGFETKYVSEPVVDVLAGRYADGSTALVVFSDVGEQLCKATVCLSAYDKFPRDGHVFIKTYAENEGVLEALRAAGVVGEPVRLHDVGFVGDGAAECPLLAGIEEL